jgi:hypothetical protein
MAENPALRARVSTPNGHITMSVATAAKGGSRFRVLKQDARDKFGRDLPPKPRVEVEDAPPPRKRKNTQELRDDTAAATPTTEPETVSGDTPEE